MGWERVYVNEEIIVRLHDNRPISTGLAVWRPVRQYLEFGNERRSLYFSIFSPILGSQTLLILIRSLLRIRYQSIPGQNSLM